jgi:predicted TIM-barrel fold metal-dependent hydrolase
LREGCISILRECDNVYAETSGTLPDTIELATDIDEDRVLFGSDIPYYRYPTQIAIVEAANIPQKVKRKVFSDNFQRLFGKSRKESQIHRYDCRGVTRCVLKTDF